MPKETQNLGQKFNQPDKGFRLDDIFEVEKIFKEAEKEEQDLEEDTLDEEDTCEDESERLSNALIEKIERGGNIQEALREVIHSSVKNSYADKGAFSQKDPTQDDGFKIIESKRKELYALLENIDGQLAGKSTKEVAAYFVSLLDIQSQLCLQKTEGVIAIRTRLYNFFPSLVQKGGQAMRQEITLIFSPEEVKAMRMRFADMADDDPLKPFFTSTLDQAYDVVQYNEMSGNLLLEMSNYFLNKLSTNGYGNTTKAVEFKERHERARLSMQKAIGELREIEMVINRHLSEREVLVEFPKFLRALIQIKLGLLPAKHTNRILQQIQTSLGNYARARSAVAFDFNRLPSYQHGVRLRQSIILNLHKDILEYTGELFEKEFLAVQQELKQMMEEIEASSEQMDPNSPEYEEMMQRKALIQKKVEEQRRKLDIVKSQEKLVDVQHTLCNDAIQRYNKQEALLKKVDEELNSRTQIDPDKVRKIGQASKKKTSRMVMAKRR